MRANACCIMAYFTSIRLNTLSRRLTLACAAGALAFASVGAGAADSDSLDPVQLDPIIVIAPTVKVVGRDAATGAPIEEVTVSAQIPADPAALRTEYGALMLEYSVRDAARWACHEADPLTADDGSCFRNAVASAQAQVDAAIAQARSTPSD
jgi:UrcA family protein